MKIVTASNGKQTVKMSKTEWQQMGQKAGWVTAQQGLQMPPPPPASGAPIDQAQSGTNVSFNGLMQDQKFAQMYNSARNLKKYLQNKGLNYSQYPELLEIFGN